MKYSKIIALASLLGFLSACNNDPLNDLSVEESQVFITNKDESVNFKQFKTFSILDSVLVVGNQGTGSSLTDLDIKFLTSVAREMESLGDLGAAIGVHVEFYPMALQWSKMPRRRTFWPTGLAGSTSFMRMSAGRS